MHYRDDAHTAAWLPLGVTGPAWEALTRVWRDEAHTAAALVERAPNRQVTAEEYEDALQGLAGRGWLEATADGYRLTPAGRQVREEAEAATDRLFYAGWAGVSDDELSRMSALARRATANLRQAALNEFWPLANSVSAAINPLATSVVRPLMEHHIAQPRRFMPLLMTYGAAPDDFGATDFARRNPYANPERITAILDEMAAEGFVVREENGRVVLAARGKEALDKTHAGFHDRLSEFETLPANELEELLGLLRRVGDAALAAAEPADKYVLENSRRGHYPATPALGRIDQALDDLNAFRDMAHIAAWQPLGLSGRAWESFTFLWRGDAASGEALAQKLPQRGYTAADYDQALGELSARGWAMANGDGYAITDEGRRARTAVEAETDRLFYGPWAALSGGEQNRLRTLLIHLKLKLEKLAADASPD
jgi:DNA-binding MarR family transcriptional regulator